MIQLYDSGVYLINRTEIVADDDANAGSAIKRKTGKEITKEQAKNGTMAYSIIKRHNHSTSGENLEIMFDSLGAHDITYVGIIQTAKASGLTEFPVPFVLTNCHNSLCAVGGTINQDDHMFGLSAAKKYGGIYVPPNLAVIHSFDREMMCKCGNMILCSDSHTRYGALGVMGVGEGGGELVKQLLKRAYELKRPDVIAVYLTGKPRLGVGPQDVALSIIGQVYRNGYAKNKVMEFIGDGIANLSMDFRIGIDIMTTETACWSSIWTTDDQVKEYYEIHGKERNFQKIEPQDIAYYDGMIYVDLHAIEPVIALPFHPSNVYTIREFKKSAAEIINASHQSGIKIDLSDHIQNGDVYVNQGIIAGCSGGTIGNITAAADILNHKSIGNGTFQLSVYPDSQPDYLELIRNGSIAKLIKAGSIIHSAFCGPCFGACDTPANQGFSIRHTTRNFPYREGSRPDNGQLSYVALMDTRSIAATALNSGKLTAATDIDVEYSVPKYCFDQEIYKKHIYNGVGKPSPDTSLVYGPNIKDWSAFPSLPDHMLLKVVSFITDPVTTTDELIPSGETSSYRSNPIKLADYTLFRKDPNYVPKAKGVREIEKLREEGKSADSMPEEYQFVFKKIRSIEGYATIDLKHVGIGSTIFANRPGDGSAREQAASCQRILGGWANIAAEYATKRYRSNLINWGILPFTVKDKLILKNDDFIFIQNIFKLISEESESVLAYRIRDDIQPFHLSFGDLTENEKNIILAGCLINYYNKRKIGLK